MFRLRATDRSLILSLLVLLAFFPAGQTLAATQPGLTVGLQGTGQQADRPLPVVSRATYEIHVWGGMAVGTLTQEFVNAEESDARVIYETTNALGVDVRKVDVETDGAVSELKVEQVQPANEKAARKGRKSKSVQAASRSAGAARLGATPKLRTVRSEPFDLLADESTLLRADLSWPIPLDGRIFRLTVPAIQPHGIVPADAKAIPVQLSVVVHADRQLDVAQSETHGILVDYVGDKTIIEPVEAEIPGDRPFELRFAVNNRESPTVTGYHISDDAGRVGVEALIQPPEITSKGTVRPKQILFIVDSSGSMQHSEKMDQARRAVLSCVEKLSEADRFNIVEFDHDHHFMAPAPVDTSSLDKDQVEQWLDRVQADGATKILSALDATLEQPEDTERHRMIVVLTDGAIKDEIEALALLREKLGEARLFVVGTGRDSRQETLLRLAEYGRGAAVFAGDEESLEQAVEELFASISRPLGWDVELDLGSAVVEEISPSRLPDLYAGRPVRVFAWVDGDLPSQMSLRMSTVDGDRLYRVLLPPVAD